MSPMRPAQSPALARKDLAMASLRMLGIPLLDNQAMREIRMDTTPIPRHPALTPRVIRQALILMLAPRILAAIVLELTLLRLPRELRDELRM